MKRIWGPQSRTQQDEECGFRYRGKHDFAENFDSEAITGYINSLQLHSCKAQSGILSDRYFGAASSTTRLTS